MDSQYISEVWRKVLNRRCDDTEGAITTARTLLESGCKHILDERRVEYMCWFSLKSYPVLVASLFRRGLSYGSLRS